MTENAENKNEAPLAAEENLYEKNLRFWLGFPIKHRPLEFVPGRNRREKRMFRARGPSRAGNDFTRP